MTNKQKIEKWLDKQIEAGKVGREDLKINKSLTLHNASAREYIQLYDCLHQIAKILELEVIQSEPSRLSDGRITLFLILYPGGIYEQLSEICSHTVKASYLFRNTHRGSGTGVMRFSCFCIKT